MGVPRFWREINTRYNIIGVKCKKCSSVYFPPREVCLKCGSGNFEPHKLGKYGKIISYTVIRVPPEGFEKEVPYIVAIIELDDGPRLTAQVIDCDPDEVKIGQRVRSSFRRISEDGNAGVIYYGYKFKIVNNE